MKYSLYHISIYSILLLFGLSVGLRGEDFENGIGDWSIEGDIWQVGLPTHGPSAPFNGQAVAGTILNANYSPEDAQGRFISPAFTVPDTTFPRIHYHQWYDFGASDYGRVEIRKIGNDWQEVPNETVFSHSQRWSQRIIDLRDFIGQTIQISFKFVSVDTVYSNDNGPGWFIDDFRLETNPMEFGGRDDFEDGFGDWSVEGGIWQVGLPSNGPEAPFSGEALAGTIIDGDYSSEDAQGRFISPAFTVPDTTFPRIHYHQWYEFGASDYGRVEIRKIGNDWQEVSNETIYFSSQHWSQRIIDLRNYIGQTIQISFYFVSVDSVNSNDNGPGWFIDDFRLETIPMEFDGREEFENGFGDWSVEGGIWQIGMPNVGPEAPFSGQGVAGTILNGKTFNSAHAHLVSPHFLEGIS
jgi:bacillopeptidase F (M6 metalloprotease family)